MPIKIEIILDQQMYEESENILRRVIEDAFRSYRSYRQEKVSISEMDVDGHDIDKAGKRTSKESKFN
jgi:hypothetical protein